ncbi:glycerate kinase [Canibacter sp. lx-45]|uniref:glycerate kinase n=1 Tax=Canibacter zhuwentaonis TaxID=2837491 RepID=UPI001BDBB60F|nr:glycerate kinase [Canibacter zhuwentaonis]MBT1034883.1 glycerate kinase [Canibacter zhuwentaonis]
MKVLIAVDKFKGSLSGAELAREIAVGLRENSRSDTVISVCNIADGGDGTVAAAVSAGFSEQRAQVTGPAGIPVRASYAYRASDATAVIEIAQACGLSLLEGELLPLTATSYGVGELLLHALDTGARRIIIGLGGSATTDAGAGMLRALGARFEGVAAGHIRGAKDLATLTAADLSEIDERIFAAELTVACDVNNPLLGENGAAAVYAPQKGATAAQIAQLENALELTANAVEDALKTPPGSYRDLPGAGAAGGLGFACMAVLGAKMRAGADVVFNITGFYEQLATADLVITGEGKLDAQSLCGKGPAAVAAAAAARNIPVAMVCGVSDLTPEQLADSGVAAVYQTVSDTVTVAESLRDPRTYVRAAAAQLARDFGL